MNAEYLKTFMHEYGLSVAAMAEHIGVSRIKLSNKLSSTQADKLNADDIAAIKAYLLKLHKETREFLASDLNELPERLK